MKRIAFALALIFSTVASANDAPAKFSCGNVAGIEEWTIYIDLANDRAGFFDNDTTVVVPLKEIYWLKSMPPEKMAIFSGRDTTQGRKNATMTIYFNETQKTAAVSFDNGKGDEWGHPEVACKADNSVNLGGEEN